MNPGKCLHALQNFDAATYRSGVSNESLIIERSGDLSVEYAPFDHIELDAELAIVRLTVDRRRSVPYPKANSIAQSTLYGDPAGEANFASDLQLDIWSGTMTCLGPQCGERVCAQSA